MAIHAWPYAVSRDERSGYQAFVVPEFLADAGQAYILEYASKGEAGQPDTVTVREVRGAVIEPLSLVYRVTETRHEPGQGHPGGTVRVFEGLVLQVPAEQVASLGLSVADADAVASITVPALGRRRAARTPAEAEPSAAICVGAATAGARLLDLRMAKPWLVPGSAERLGARPRDRQPGPSHARPGRSGLVLAAAAVSALAGLLVWYLTGQLPQSPPAVRASVQRWCSDVSSGRADDVYLQLSGPYRHSTSLATFESRLLGSGNSATCTATAAAPGQASLSLRCADGQDRTVNLILQDQQGQWRITAMKVTS